MGTFAVDRASRPASHRRPAGRRPPTPPAPDVPRQDGVQAHTSAAARIPT